MPTGICKSRLPVGEARPYLNICLIIQLIKGSNTNNWILLNLTKLHHCNFGNKMAGKSQGYFSKNCLIGYFSLCFYFPWEIGDTGNLSIVTYMCEKVAFTINYHSILKENGGDLKPSCQSAILDQIIFTFLIKTWDLMSSLIFSFFYTRLRRL